MRGRLEAGRFHAIDNDIDSDLPKTVPVPVKSPQGRSLNAWVVRGDSMNLAGIVDGMTIISTDTLETGYSPREGDCVVVERRIDGSEVERTVKQVHLTNDSIVLKPVSTNPAHRSYTVKRQTDPDENVTVQVIGRVVKLIRDM